MRGQGLGWGLLGEGGALAGEVAARAVAGQGDGLHARGLGGGAPRLQRVPLQSSHHLVQAPRQDHPVPALLLHRPHASSHCLDLYQVHLRCQGSSYHRTLNLPKLIVSTLFLRYPLIRISTSSGLEKVDSFSITHKCGALTCPYSRQEANVDRSRAAE